MPNDAKLGLVVGVGVVIAVAVVFFRKEAGVSLPSASGATAAAVGSPKDPAADSGRGSGRPMKVKHPAQAEGSISQMIPAIRRHIVKDGDTLAALAEQYYGDREKADLIFQANRDVLRDFDDITPGSRLIIPSLSNRQPAPAAQTLDP